MRVATLLLLAFLLAGAPSWCQGLKLLSIIGDSLSDPGNTKRLFDIPQDAYGGVGAYSDSKPWPSYIKEKYAKSLKLRNVAFGSATACEEPNFGPYFASINTQTDYLYTQYATPLHYAPQERAVAIFAGHNDYEVQLGLYAQNLTTQAEIARKMTQDVPACIAAVVQRLLGYGERNILVFTLAPMDATPAIASMGPDAVAGTAQLFTLVNSILNQTISGIAAATNTPGLQIFDANKLGTYLQGQARLRKLGTTTIVKTPCVILANSVNQANAQVVSKCSNPAKHFYYDAVHPNSVVHKKFAQAIWKVLSKL